MLVGLALDARVVIRPPFDGLGWPGVLALLFLSVVAGLAMGEVYFRSVRASARRLAEGGSPAWWLGLGALRLSLLALGLAAVAQGGALPLLVAALGILIARGWILRRTGEDGR